MELSSSTSTLQKIPTAIFFAIMTKLGKESSNGFKNFEGVAIIKSGIRVFMIFTSFSFIWVFTSRTSFKSYFGGSQEIQGNLLENAPYFMIGNFLIFGL